MFRFDGHASAIFLAVVTRWVLETIEPEHWKFLCQHDRASADIAAVFKPLPMQARNQHGCITEKANRRFDRPRKRRNHDQVRVDL